MRVILVILKVFSLSLVFLSLNLCSESKKIKVDPKQQPSKQQLETDGQQIADYFINTVEMYRQIILVDSFKTEASIDPAHFYQPYAERVTVNGDRVPSPLPTSTQFKVSSDTILYNPDKTICFALLIIECKYSVIEGLENNGLKNPYDARAVIGYRMNDTVPYSIYPVEIFSVIRVDTYADARRMIRKCYFRDLKKTGGGVFTVFNETPFFYNLGDPQFFEKSPFFQKYDSTRYNFQMYHKLGKDYEYPQHRW